MRPCAGLAVETGDERFAWDSYRRFLQMYGQVVAGVPGDVYETALSRAKAAKGVSADVDLDPDDLRRLVETFRRLSASTRTPSRGPARAAPSVGRRRLPLVAEPARDGLPAGPRHPRRPRHGRGRDADGVRQPRRDVGHGGVLHPEPVDRRQGALRRVPAERPGRGRGGGHPHAAAPGGARGAPARRLRAAPGDDGTTRGALPRHAGHRVHDRAGDALPPPDAGRQADGAGLPCGSCATSWPRGC
jgi:hypothetical protein